MSVREIWTPDRFITWLGNAGIELVTVDVATSGVATIEIRTPGDEPNPVLVDGTGRLRQLAHQIYREHRRAPDGAVR